MKRNEYKFKSGVCCPASAEDAHNELERVRNSNGELTAEILLTESTPEEAVLHEYYEWDNSIAGHKFRISQSRDLINGILVIIINEQESSINESQEWVGIKMNNEDAQKKEQHGNTRNYFTRDEVSNSDELKKIHLENLKSRMIALINRYESYQNNEVVKKISSLIKKL